MPESQSRYNIVKELSDKKLELLQQVQVKKDALEKDKQALVQKKATDEFNLKRWKEDNALNDAKIDAELTRRTAEVTAFESSVKEQVAQLDAALTTLENLSKGDTTKQQ